MLSKTLHCEILKLKRSPIWLALLIVPILPAAMGTFNYLQNTAVLKSEWYSLWTQHTLFLCYFFFPVLMGIFAAYLYRLEHINHNWNAVLSVPTSVSAFCLSKLIIASLMVFLTQLWIGLLFIVSGKLCGISSPIPVELITWLAFGILGGISLTAVQLAFSLIIRSFAIPVGIALVGGFAGFGAFVKGYGVWFPYSLYSLGMKANDPSGSFQADPALFIEISLLYVIISIVFCTNWLRRKDTIV